MQEDDDDNGHTGQPQDEIAQHGSTPPGDHKIEPGRNGIVAMVAALQARPPRRC